MYIILISSIIIFANNAVKLCFCAALCDAAALSCSQANSASRGYALSLRLCVACLDHVREMIGLIIKMTAGGVAMLWVAHSSSVYLCHILPIETYMICSIIMRGEYYCCTLILRDKQYVCTVIMPATYIIPGKQCYCTFMVVIHRIHFPTSEPPSGS